MRDVVNLGRLVRINDHLIELLKWAIGERKTRLRSATGTDHEGFYFCLSENGG